MLVDTKTMNYARLAAMGFGTESIEAVRKWLEGHPDGVPHGRWEKYVTRSGVHNFRCSHCRKYHFHNGAMVRELGHCPNCGAVMDLTE